MKEGRTDAHTAAYDDVPHDRSTIIEQEERLDLDVIEEDAPRPRFARATPYGGGSLTGDLEAQALARTELARPALPPRTDFEGHEPTVPLWSESRLLDAGARIGRLLVLRSLARGGVGAVVLAYDPDLDRRVAVKVLRPDIWRLVGAEARDRLQREAVVMARLAHPNIVTVYDVGIWNEQAFIAMEFVDGPTLSEWVRERPRSWREVLDVCMAAGRGLAAAHKSGIVHRDLKPANVLCGRDGWVRVTDFGVAALLDDARSTGGDEELVSGTAGYMSPEQMEGRAIDARSDQFGFCVTAWEALTGGRPFGGTSLPAVWHAVHSGQEPVPPAGVMPARVRRVLLRGLQPDPAARFASMDELLSALGGAGGGRRRWVKRGAVAAAVAAAALVGAVTAGGGGGAETCAGAEERVAAVWNPQRRAAVERVFSAGGFDDPGATARRFTGAIDQRAGGWITARTAACRATRVTGEQSEQVLDARMECLDDQLRGIDSLVGGVAAGDGSLFAALDAAHALPDAELCSTASMRARGVPASFPAGSAARDQASKVDLLLARARIAIAMMDSAGAREALDAAAPLAAALPDPIRQARVSFERGRAAEGAHDFDGAKAAFIEAAGVAARAGAQRIVAEAAVRMTFLVGVQQQRPREAEAWAAAAELEISRGGDDDWLRGFLDLTRGQMAYQARNYQAAVAAAGRALERYRQAGSGGGDAPGVLGALRLESSARQDLGELARAADVRREALTVATQTFGPDHPHVAAILTLSARADADGGDLAAARKGFERALAIRERALGPAHPLVSESRGDLGIVAAELGDVKAAEEHLRRWLAAEEEAELGGAHLAAPLFNLASLLHDTGRNAEARELLERTMAVYEEARGPTFGGLVAPLIELAEIDEEERGCAWARPRLERARTIADGPGGPDPTLSYVLIPLALCEIETGSAEKALEMARRAGALREAAGMPESLIAETRFAEAHALAAAGRHAEAKSVATAARRGASPKLAASIDQWLSKKTRRR